MSNSLTPEEIEQELQIEKRRIAFLDAKLAALTEQQREQAMNYLTRTAQQAMDLLQKRNTQWRLYQFPKAPVLIRVAVLSTKHNVLSNTGRVAPAAAWSDKMMIGILNLYAFAPKEVIQKLVIHETLHIVYNTTPHISPPKAIRASITRDYPTDIHSEEEWVRQMEERICGATPHIELWEVAVDEGGENWKPLYKRLVKIHRHRR